MSKDIIRVDWIDSCASNMNWVMESEFEGMEAEPIKITTVGVKVLDDERYIVVAQNYGVNPKQFCSLMSIPKGCIEREYIMDKIEFEDD